VTASPWLSVSHSRAGLRLASLAVVLALATGCEFPGQPRAGDRPVPSDRVLDFGALYARNCAGCHGADGTLGPAPPLNDPVFLAIVPDDVLTRLVAEGRPGTPMPGFARSKGGPLTDPQVRVLAEGLKARWAKPLDVAEAPPAYRAAGGGPGDRGSGVFARACAGCHGEMGEGDSAGGLNDPAFLSLISDQALRRLAITGRPDLGMPRYNQDDGREDGFRPLTSEEIDDLVRLLASWRRSGVSGRP
jgi:mono/diheme cytochrome c family protein